MLSGVWGVGPGAWRWWQAVGLIGAVAASCGRPSVQLGGRCELNSECQGLLVCRLGRCRNECRGSRDCAFGLRCVRSEDGLGACQLDTEASCTLSSECEAPLVCRSQTCTNACENDRDCPSGELCEEDERGGKGCQDPTTESCRLNSDCPQPLVCAVDQRCREQCRTDRDCRDGQRCDVRQAPAVCRRLIEPQPPDPVGGANAYSCTVREQALFCWGTLDTPPASLPAAVALPGTSRAVTAVGGAGFLCVLDQQGQVLCSGRNDEGQLGLGNLQTTPTPTRVDLPARALQVTAARAFACAVLEDRSARCWGRNQEGQLGDGTTTQRTSPVRVQLSDVARLEARGDHACALTSIGETLCWGKNESGELGLGSIDTDPHPTPQPVASLPPSTEISLGANHSCARALVGDIYCWGSNAQSQLGVAAPREPSPTARRLSEASALGLYRLASGLEHSCGLARGEVHCWGGNVRLQCGKAITSADDQRLTLPHRISLPGGGAVELLAGDTHTCAASATATYCWGSNQRGELGIDVATTSGTATPQLITLP